MWENDDLSEGCGDGRRLFPFAKNVLAYREHFPNDVRCRHNLYAIKLTVES